MSPQISGKSTLTSPNMRMASKKQCKQLVLVHFECYDICAESSECNRIGGVKGRIFWVVVEFKWLDTQQQHPRSKVTFLTLIKVKGVHISCAH